MGNLKSIICSAIAEKRLLQVSYKGKMRIVEPYLLFRSKAGNATLHSWQVEGAWEETPPPDWCTLSLSQMESREALGPVF